MYKHYNISLNRGGINMETKAYKRKPDYTYMDGNCQITICEDYIPETQEELEANMKNAMETMERVFSRAFGVDVKVTRKTSI